MRFLTRIGASAALVATVSLAGCGDLLDVKNPNNLTEESVQRIQAAAAVVNGSEALVYSAISQIWLPYLTVSDDLVWGSDGSRDAWGSLDEGQIADPLNEFIDAYFPAVAQARWMADEAIRIVDGHVAEAPDDGDLKVLQARANLYAGIIYMIVGEVMNDFAFSDKAEEGAPVGSAGMSAAMFGPAITYFGTALSIAQAESNASLALAAQAFRARAYQSRAIRDKIQPTPNTADPLVSVAEANADAAAVLAAADADWYYAATYSAATIDNTMADWINSRQEPVVNPTLWTLSDPVDAAADSAAAPIISRFAQASEEYTPLTLVSTRQMHLILAEAALAEGGAVQGGSFTEHINNLRDLDGLAAYSGQIGGEEMLEYSRRANLPLQGQRLADMYRFGVADPLWLPNNTASTAPGALVPISCVEIRANSLIPNEGC